MFDNVDEQTDAGVIGILIAHLGAFGSGELIKTKACPICRKIFDGTKKTEEYKVLKRSPDITRGHKISLIKFEHGQDQSRLIIKMYFIWPQSAMIHTKNIGPLDIKKRIFKLSFNCAWLLFFVMRPAQYHIGLDARKPVFGGLQITKAQTSLRIRADSSAPL